MVTFSVVAELQMFFHVAEAWDLNIEQQTRVLGLSSPDALAAWRGHAEDVPPAVVERIWFLTGIYSELHALFVEPIRADSWIHRPNTAALFGGAPAVDLLYDDKAADVYTYLRGQPW